MDDTSSESATTERSRLFERILAFSGHLNFWSTVVTATTAVVALILSLVTYAQVNSNAEISMSMPNTIRIFGNPAALSVVMGPTFYVDEKTDVAAFVSDTQLLLQSPASTEARPYLFHWASYVRLTGAATGEITSVEYIADSGPFPVKAEGMEILTLDFKSITQPGSFQAGKWLGELTVVRRNDSDLVTKFCLDISDSDARSINGYFDSMVPTPGILLSELRIDVSLENAGGECYQSARRN